MPQINLLLCASCDYSVRWKPKGRQYCLSKAQKKLLNHCIWQHMTVVDGEKIVCDSCSRSFMFTKNLCSHIYNRHRNRDADNFYVCETDMCQQQFYRKANFQNHIVMRHLLNDVDTEGALCDHCGHWSKLVHTIQRHIVDRHLYNGIAFPCEICGKECHSHKALLAHKLGQHSQTSVCYICERAFKQKGNLMDHIKYVQH